MTLRSRANGHAYLTLALLGLVLLFAAMLRLNNLDWDQGSHIHPDERFLTMVETALALPKDLSQYFHTPSSPLNPYNRGFNTFIYGTLPLFLVKVTGHILGQGGYDEIHLVGRALSALFDLATVLLTFLLGRRLFGSWVGIGGAALVAFVPLHIQNAHFFTVDSFSVTFALACLYFVVRSVQEESLANYALAGAFLGMAAASKLNSLLLLGPLFLAGYYSTLHGRSYTTVGRGLGVALLATFVTFRIFEPYAFAGTNLLDIRPNPSFVRDLAQWTSVFSGEADYPPSIQWAHTTPYLYPVAQMVQWGMGWPLGLLSVVAALYSGSKVALWPRRYWAHAILILWVLLNFFYFGGQLAKAMRYFLGIYPPLTILSMSFLSEVSVLLSTTKLRGRLWQHLGSAVAALVLVTTALYGIAFASIYTRPLTRVAASDWIYRNVPGGSTVANEHWDDPLPLRRPGGDPSNYKGITMELYNPDDASKLQKLLQALDQAQYIFLSSNRLYGSITKMPQRWPLTTEYYRLLFAGQLGFHKVAEFTSRPQLFGIEIIDDGAEELFTVYDHPNVIILKKGTDYSSDRVRQLLSSVDLSRAIPMKPIQADKNGLLLPEERSPAETAWSWSDLFSVDSLPNQLPVLFWLLVVELLGIVGLLLLRGLLSSLPDAGYGIAKVLGLLFVAFPPWLLASIGVARFGPLTLWLTVIVLLGAGAISVAVAPRAVWDLLSFRWRQMLSSEIAFLAGFALFAYLRARNPDLWHPIYGGEKPMDFAYFNAVLRSGWFPPYDPWFAGGYINYYYFGFVLAAVPTILTGVVPWVAYNLLVTTFFSFLASAAFSVGMAMVGRTRHFPRQALAGILATVFVGVIGNLDGAIQGLQGLISLGGGNTAPTEIPVSILRGLVALLSGKHLPQFDFWRSTRVIGPEDPGPITEFPYFTFLYGDLHAHLLALPFTVATIGLAYSLMGRLAVPTITSSWWKGPWGVPPAVLIGYVVLGGLLTGALRATNTWDFPTYTLLLTLAFGLHQVMALKKLDLSILGRTFALAAGLVITSAVLFFPYLKNYELFYSGIEPVRSKTWIWHYVTIWGTFLVIVTPYVVRRTLALDPFALASTSMATADPKPLAVTLQDSRVLSLAVAIALTALALAVGLLGYTVPCLGLLISALIVTSLSRARYQKLLMLTMALMAVTLTVMVEFIALKGDIGRMNTVFKFYLQAWVMLALASAAILADHIFINLSRGKVESYWKFYLGFVALLLAGNLIYPLAGTPARLAYRFQRLPLTLDGTAFMRQSTYREKDVEIALNDDLQGILWLLRNVKGAPVVLEAPPAQIYRSWGGRISIYTGFPTVIGWDWHEKQQRWGYPGLVEKRLSDVKTLYETPSPRTKLDLLKRYRIQYIYVGAVERAYYSPQGLQTFDQMVGQWLEIVYKGPSTVVYKVKLDTLN